MVQLNNIRLILFPCVSVISANVVGCIKFAKVIERTEKLFNFVFT